jgi:hypothetical protein
MHAACQEKERPQLPSPHPRLCTLPVFRLSRCTRVQATHSNSDGLALALERDCENGATIETNSQFFFGSGDGSSGYYAERPELTLALVR